MHRIVALLALAFVAACSSTTRSEAPSGPCGTPEGAYSVHYEKRGGSCDGLNDEVVILGEGDGGATSSCTGEQSLGGDGCAVTSDLSCILGDGYHSTLRAKVTWSSDLRIATGIMSVTLYSGTTYVCSGSYDVAYSRL